MGRATALATLVAGTLDIAFAMVLTLLAGREIGAMLRYVGSGPFPPATELGAIGSLIGLLTHFVLMAIMAAIYFAFARRRRALLDRPLRWGTFYGLATYFVMNWIIVPLRFDTPLPPSVLSAITQLFAHVVLVGIPIALVASRTVRRQGFV